MMFIYSLIKIIYSHSQSHRSCRRWSERIMNEKSMKPLNLVNFISLDCWIFLGNGILTGTLEIERTVMHLRQPMRRAKLTAALAAETRQPYLFLARSAPLRGFCRCLSLNDRRWFQGLCFQVLLLLTIDLLLDWCPHGRKDLIFVALGAEIALLWVPEEAATLQTRNRPHLSDL